jgi:O-antigen ligase
VLGAALAGAMVNIGLALAQVVAGGPYPVPLSVNIDAKLDLSGEVAANLPTGLFNHPNALAVSLLPVVLFLLVAVGVGFRAARRRAPLMVALLAPALVVLDLTYAKGVYTWLAVAACFLVLPRRLDRYRAWLAVAIVVAGITGLVWYALAAFLDGDLVFGTIVSRVELWLATLNIVSSDAFVTGFGGGGALLAGENIITFEYTNAHNAWLDQALTYGVPALVLYLGAYLTALRSLARRIATEPHPTRAVALATFASLVAVLGESFFEPTNHNAALQCQLFLLFALAAVSPSSRQPASTRR